MKRRVFALALAVLLTLGGCSLPGAPAGTPTPSPTPTVTPFDFSRSAPETAAVANDNFGAAVFIGDSRTEGLRL